MSPAQKPQRTTTKPLVLDRHPFTGAPSGAASLAVADLQVGTAPATGLRPEKRGDVDINEFSKKLHGTWVRESTWSGVPLETTSAMYFDTRSNLINAMIFDQSNQSKGPLWYRLQTLKANHETLMKTPTMTFVSPDVLCVDRYFKISDALAFDGLDVRPDSADPTRSVFDQLNHNGFMKVKLDAATIKRESKNPAAQYMFPSARLVHWRGTLTSTTIGGGRGVTLMLEGQYRAAYVAQGKAVNSD